MFIPFFGLSILGFLLRHLGVGISRRRRPRPFYRTPKTHRPLAGWVVVYTNRARRKHGRGPLGRHLVLQSAAQGHSNWMSRTGVFSHVGAQGLTPHTRMKKAGWAGSATGENIYKYPKARNQQRLARNLVDGWMKSPGHRANILHGSFRYIGVGVQESGGYVWATQNFGGV